MKIKVSNIDDLDKMYLSKDVITKLKIMDESPSSFYEK